MNVGDSDAGIVGAYGFMKYEQHELDQIHNPVEREKLKLSIKIAHEPKDSPLRAALENALLSLLDKTHDKSRSAVAAVLSKSDASNAPSAVLNALINTDGFFGLSAQDRAKLNSSNDLMTTQDELLSIVSGRSVKLSAAEKAAINKRPA
jgi:hypothetical protein